MPACNFLPMGRVLVSINRELPGRFEKLQTTLARAWAEESIAFGNTIDEITAEDRLEVKS